MYNFGTAVYMSIEGYTEIVLWHVDPLLGNGCERSSYQTVIVK
jgi:hypothetical protein